jgi:L-threonylcarbamoyladenylate synthase
MSYMTNQIDQKVVGLLSGGSVGFLPTDTIYGLSAVAMNEQAVERIHHLKGRDGSTPLIVLIADIEQLDSLGLKKDDADLIKKYWPGPLSVEFDAASAPSWLHRGNRFFAVRMPNNKELRELINTTGPIVSTSANLHGKKPASTTSEAERYFGKKLDFYVGAEKLEGEPSTLVKIENGQIKVLRQGAFPIKA